MTTSQHYPQIIPSYATLTDVVGGVGGSVVNAEDTSAPNRDVEGMRAVIGDNPQTIAEVSPVNPTPQTIGDILDMLAYIVKTRVGATNWYTANVPMRFTLSGSGGGATVAGSSTAYGGFFFNGLNATEAIVRIPVAYAGSLQSLNVQTITAQPAGGSLVFTLIKNGVSTGFAFTYAAGAAASTQSALIVGGYAVAAGDTLDWKIVNGSGSASAQVGAFSLEFDQQG